MRECVTHQFFSLMGNVGDFLPKNRVCRGGVGSEFTMEKFAKYYLDQMIKISVTSDKVC